MIVQLLNIDTKIQSYLCKIQASILCVFWISTANSVNITIDEFSNGDSIS